MMSSLAKVADKSVNGLPGRKPRPKRRRQGPSDRHPEKSLKASERTIKVGEDIRGKLMAGTLKIRALQ